jgi:hypothetical protein
MSFCEKCGTQVDGTDRVCKTCGSQVVVGQPVDTEAAIKLSKRYRDSYRVANGLVGIGTFIKVIGCISGGLIVLIGIIGLAASNGVVGVQEGMFVSVLFVGFTVGAVLFVMGVFVSSQGQVLRATVDSAVNNSPLLVNSDRIAIMGL